VFEKTDLINYILHEVNFGISWLLAIGLPEIPAWGFRDWSEDEVMEGQIATLLLLAENKNIGFFTILDQFHQFLSAKLLQQLILRVSRTKFGPEALE
jgi:hypothetical protein